MAGVTLDNLSSKLLMHKHKASKDIDWDDNIKISGSFIYFVDNDNDETKAGTVRIGRDLVNNTYGQWILKTNGTWQPIQVVSTNI